MFDFIKNMFCHCDSRDDLESRREAAIQQDKEIRESLTEKEIDRGLKDTMAASDPVAKY
jgi:hypothetical protein